MVSHSDSLLAGLRSRWRWHAALLACVMVLACMKPAALWAIEGYQRWISPHKGYRCAYGALYGTSCSPFAKKAICDYGLIGGLILLRQQFRNCHDAAVRVRSGVCQVRGARAEDSDECIESDRDRGKRDAERTRDYCAGCTAGLCGKD